MGNDPSREFSLEEKVETVSNNIWTLYRCLGTEAACPPLSLFLYDLTSPRCKRQFVENAAKYLKVLRHPHIIRFHALSYTSKEAWLVTEHVTPLEMLLESLTADEIIAGLYNLIEALSFLHDRGGLCHNNVSISSVFVADDGTWKLGAMECVCRHAEATPAFLLQYQSIRSEKAIAPEEKNQKISANLNGSRDVYALGVFAEYLLEYLADSGEKVKNFQRIIQEDLLNADPTERPKLNALLEDSFFRTDFVEICCFLKQITVKNEDEKSKFFRAIVQRLYHLPQRLIATRLVKPLLSRFVVLDHEACQHLIPHLLLPASGDNRGLEYREDAMNPVLTEPFFQHYVIPEIYKIFHVRDAHIRSVLLRHFHQYAGLFDHSALADVIFPQILLSVRDANDELVMLSLKAIAFLVPILGGDIIVGSERPKLFYEGIPKFSAVANGRSSYLPNGLTMLSQSDHPTTVRSSLANHIRASDQSLVAAERRQQKREEAKIRLEERRKREREKKMLPPAHKDFPSVSTKDVLQTNAEDDEECVGNLSDDSSPKRSYADDRDEIPQSPQSRASFDRTDSEIELEIEAELEAMKQAEEKAARSISSSFNDARIGVKVDWSDVNYVSQSTEPAKQSKGRLKLTVDKTELGNKETSRFETMQRSVSAHAVEAATLVDDQWNDDAGWEDFDPAPESLPSPKTESSSGFSPSPLSTGKMSSAHKPRTRSIEEPLGAGYDIMLLDIKAKPTQRVEEFDFFADMAPEIKPSGGSLLGILSGGTSDKGFLSTTKVSAEKVQRQGADYVKSFEVVSTDAEGAVEIGGGWDAELDWNVDEKS